MDFQLSRPPSLHNSPAVFNINNPFAYTTDPHGAFGSVPQDVPMPNPFGDLSKIYPGLAAANASVSRNIGAQLNGQLSPATQNAIQDASAQFGVSSGMPGSGLQRSRTARDLGLATQAIQDQGLKNYLASLQTISGTQTVNPALQTEINTQNTLNRAAPNPTQAAAYSKRLFDEYLANLRGPAGGTLNRGLPPSLFAPTTPPSTYTSSGIGFPAPAAPPPYDAHAINNNTPWGLIQDAPAYESPYGAIQDAPPYPFGVENYDMFSPEQQANYPDQLAWAQSFGGTYE